MEGVLDAPDSTAARPGLRLRVAGLIVLGLFGLLGLRLWALTVLQAPAAAHTVSVNQIRARCHRAPPAVSSWTATATRWSTTRW